jgi:hypothetical protein
MKKTLILIALIGCIFFITGLYSQDFTYVGAEKCRICHRTDAQGRQYLIWEASKHSKSFEALSTEKATQIAKEQGVQNPAESPQCLKCHSPLYEKAPELKSEGVECEVCHGPGSEYRKMSIMKDPAEAVKNGLKLYKSPDEIKAQCLTCHENAHGTTFDFTAAWDKVKHPIPEK